MPFLAPTCAPWFSNNTPLQATLRLFLHSLWHSFVSYFFSIGLEDCARLGMRNLQLHGNAVGATVAQAHGLLKGSQSHKLSVPDKGSTTRRHHKAALCIWTVLQLVRTAIHMQGVGGCGHHEGSG